MILPTFLVASVAVGLEPATFGGAWPAFPLAVMDAGEWIAAAAAGLAAIGGILIFIRREARMREPNTDHTVTVAPPVTIRHEEVFVERHEHVGLRSEFVDHKREIWEVVKGLRSSMSRIETSVGETKVLREANGELLTEVREDVKKLNTSVARLAGIVETKMEAKGK